MTIKWSKSHSNNAFTLIELLVVIAIIAILAAILIPSMARLLDKGRHTGCIANMRALAQGTSAFAYDNDGYLPAPGWGGGRHPTWLYTNYAMMKPDDVKSGQIWPYVGSMDAYRCPADSPPDPVALAKIQAIQPNNCYNVSSYCMNGSVIAFGWKRGAYDGSTFIAGQRLTLTIEMFQADDIILWEADQRKITRGMWWDASNRPDEGMTDRHFTWGSVGCIDGHVEKMENDDFYLVNAPSNLGRTRLWNIPSAFSADGN